MGSNENEKWKNNYAPSRVKVYIKLKGTKIITCSALGGPEVKIQILPKVVILQVKWKGIESETIYNITYTYGLSRVNNKTRQFNYSR